MSRKVIKADGAIPVLLEDLVRIATKILAAELGLDRDKAELVGMQIADTFAVECGGQSTYIPKAFHFRRYKQYMQIWEEFTGDNHNELALKHDLSVQSIYAILKGIRQIELKKRQPDLF